MSEERRRRKQGGRTRVRRTKGTVTAPNEQFDVADPSGPIGPATSALSGRVWWLATRLLVGVAVVLGAAYGVAYGAQRFVSTTTRFAAQKFVVDGNRRYSDEQLMRIAGIRRGDNLFALDLGKAERQLSDDPWVASAKLSRKLPDTLRLEVTELRAAALAVISNAIYLVTREGTPIKELSGEDEARLPVVTGVTAEALRDDRERATERIVLGLKILRRYARMPLSKRYLAQEVHLSPDGNAELVIGETGITLRLGKWPYRQKLLMAARVMSKVRARGETPSIVFLDNQAHPERVVVRLR